MTNKLVKEGIIQCTSGKLIIADPCLVQTEVIDTISELETGHIAARRKHTEVQNNYCEEFGKITLKIAETLEDKSLTPEAVGSKIGEFTSELERKKQKYETDLEQALRRLIKTPRLSIPWLAQGDNFVFYGTRDGDGDYPVIRTPRGIKVCFDFPEDYDGNLDITRLEGKVVGNSIVDSGLQMVFDSSRFDLNKVVPRKLYAEVEAPTGTYSCRYVFKREAGFLISKKNK